MIAPALTPGEWKRINRIRQYVDPAMYERAISEMLNDVEDMPATMAVANAALADGDPRKITRADVTLLERVAEEEYHLPDSLEPLPDYTALQSLAAKLAALLQE